jgi:hypothetical protein
VISVGLLSELCMVDYELGRRPQRTLSGSLKRVGGAEAGNDSIVRDFRDWKVGLYTPCK